MAHSIQSHRGRSTGASALFSYELCELVRVLLLGGVVVSLVGLCPPSGAEAQGANRSAAARTLFEEGVAHADNGEWVEAVQSFRQARALRDSPVIAFNLAAALREDGRLVASSEAFQAVLRHPRAPEDLVERSEDAVEVLSHRLAGVRVSVSGHTEADRVVLDEVHVPEDGLGVVIPVDPGPHVLRVLRRGEETRSESFSLEEGEERAFDLVLEPDSTSEPFAMRREDTPHADSSGEDAGLTWLWVTLGAVVAVGVGVLVVGLAVSGDDPAGSVGTVDWR